MTVILPQSLFLSKRGLCPGCGAPLRLDRDDAQTKCGFCGQQAILERRLRKVEPELADAPLRLYHDGESATAGRATSAVWKRSRQYREGIIEKAACPGCGDELEYRDDTAGITCRTCGTESRLERRLWAPPPDPATEIPRARHPNEPQDRDDPGALDEHRDTEHLCFRIVNEQNPDRRLSLARRFEEWAFINQTAARLLPAVLNATRGAEPAFQYAVAQVIGKLLCEGDPELRNRTVRAAERFLFDLECPRPIILEFGMGDGVCLKPLLDAAEFAVRKGDLEYACACLVAVNWIFQRNFPQHEIMGQIILYRMLYYTGPVLAFALLLAQRQVTGTGFHYSAETLLAFMDDAAVERPGLLTELEKSFYVGWPKDDAEFESRLRLYATLKTDASRAAALRQYIRVPEQATASQWKQFFAFTLPLWEAAGPLKPAAGEALLIAIDGSYPTPSAVHDLIQQRGRTLPVEVQRCYLGRHPNTPHLTYEGLPYWESKPAPALSAEMKAALEQWNTGLHRVVDLNDTIRNDATRRLNEVRGLEVKLFDGRSDGPAPAKRNLKASGCMDAEPAEEDNEDEDESSEIERDDIDEQSERQMWESQRAAIQQAIDQMVRVREQVKTYSPESVKLLDDQIAQLKKQMKDFPKT